MDFHKFLLASLVVALFVAVPSYPQSTAGSILGDVTDASGARLPGATVKLLNQAIGATRETLTNEAGSYRFDALPPVEYTVTVELTGFATVMRQNIKVSVASQMKVDFRLEVATASETITVTEEAPLVETTEYAIKTLIDNRKIEELPLKTRDFIDLALLAPGVVSDQASDTRGSETDSVSFGGMSERFKSMWLEGVDFNDEVTGGGSSLSSATRTQLAQEAIQEFQVMANAYSAEFGRSATGVINIVTKSGTNEFHGNGFYFLRDDAFDKPNYFSQQVPPFKAAQYGVTIGGPIKLDKTHFFFSYERRTSDRSSSVVIPAALVNFANSLGYDTRTDVSVPSRFNNYFGKLTHAINPKHSLAATWVYDRRTIANTQVGGNLAADSGYDDRRKSYFLTTSLTSLFGQNFVNEVRFNKSIQTLFRDSQKTRPELSFPGITFGRDNTQGRQQRNWIVSDTMSYNAGNHSIKWGAESNIVYGIRVGGGYNGSFQFLQDRPVNPSDPSTLPYRFVQSVELVKGKVSVWGFDSGAFTRNVNLFAGFLNDSWRIRPNLTVNAGIRYDVQFWRGDLSGKPYPTNIPDFEFYVRVIQGDLRGQNWAPAPNDLTNFSPRIGLSWDPKNNGKTVVRLGYGLFVDQLWTETMRSIIQGYPGYRETSVANDTRLTGITNSFFPNYPSDRSILSEQGGTSFRVPSRIADSPYMHQYSAGVTHELRPGLAASVNYVYMFVLHFFMTRNVNARLGPNGQFPLLASGAILNLFETNNIEKVHSMQFQVEQRLTKGFTGRLAYTLGRINEFSDSPSDAYDLKADWGPSANDVRHRIVANVMYHLPLGIQLGAVAQYTSGAPYNVTTGADDNRDLANRDRPVGVSYNAGRGDTNSTVDLRTSKKFKLGESKNLEAMWEMFNVFNRVNFMQYTGNMRSSQFGKPSLARDPFQAQVGLKFTF